MTMYQVESQRAVGAASRSPSQPKPLVIPGGSKAPRVGPKPKASTVSMPAASTNRRELHSARQLSRTAVRRAASSDRSAAGARRPGRAPAGALPLAGQARPTGSMAVSAMASSAVSGFMRLAPSLVAGAVRPAGNHNPAR